MVAKLKVRPIVPTKGHDDDVCFCYFVFDDDASLNLYFNITANDPPLRSHSRKHQHRQCLRWKTTEGKQEDMLACALQTKKISFSNEVLGPVQYA